MQAMEIEEPILSPEEIRLLVEIGYLAAAFRHPDAQCIFEALRMMRPDLSAPLMGLAMYCIECGKATEAVTLLQKALDEGLQERNELRAFLGMALVAANRSYEAGRLLGHLVSDSAKQHGSSDSPEIRMAKGLLEHHALSFTSHRGAEAASK